MQGRIVGWVLAQVAAAVATAGLANAAKAGKLGELAPKLDDVAFLRDNPKLLAAVKAALERANAVLAKAPGTAGDAKRAIAKAPSSLVAKVARKVATTFNEFKVGRTFASPAEAEKAWHVYQLASRSEGLIIGKTGEIVNHAGQDGREVLYFVMDKSAPYGGWTWGINKAWLDGAIDAGLTVKILTPAADLPKSGALWREFNYLVSKGYRVEGGLLVPPVR